MPETPMRKKNDAERVCSDTLSISLDTSSVYRQSDTTFETSSA
jgi:hypothetical protein